MRDLPVYVYLDVFSGGEMLLILFCVLALIVCFRNPDFADEIGRALHQFGNALMKRTRWFDQTGFDVGRNLGGIHGKPAAEALTTENKTGEIYDHAALRENSRIERGSRSEKGKLRNAFTRALLSIVGGLVFAMVGYRLYKSLFLNSNSM